jgi:CRP-like cAMP-binding protein
VTWRALAPTRLAVLDRRFALFAARVPALGEELLARCTRRASSQALTAAVSHLTGIDDRLTMVLWHLADRWGRVGPSGVRIPLRLTHDLLAALIGARRPSVTTALRRLEDEGAVRRQPDGALLLVGEPPAADGGEAGLRVAA